MPALVLNSPGLRHVPVHVCRGLRLKCFQGEGRGAMATEGDIAYVLCKDSEDRPVPLCGWVVEVSSTEVVLATDPLDGAKVANSLSCQKAKAGNKPGYDLRFLKVPGDSLTLSAPSSWTGKRPRDLSSLEVCKEAWRTLEQKQLESSGAECPGSAKDTRPRSRTGAEQSLERELKGLSKVFGDDDESDSEEELEVMAPRRSQAASSSQAMLAPGAPVKKAKKKEKEGGQIGDLVRAGLAQGQSASELLPLAMLTMLMKKEGGGRKGEGHRGLRPGGSSSESESEADDFTRSGMKAVVSLNKMHKRILERPSRVCAEFEKEIVDELGVIQGQAWTLRDYIRRQSWGRYKGLYRCAMMDAAAYELIRNGESQAAAAQLAQNMKAKVQAVLQGGDWSAAWLLTGLPDPLARKEFAGTREEMAIVSGYLDALGKLRKKVREAHGSGRHDDEDAEDGGARPPKK